MMRSGWWEGAVFDGGGGVLNLHTLHGPGDLIGLGSYLNVKLELSACEMASIKERQVISWLVHFWLYVGYTPD